MKPRILIIKLGALGDVVRTTPLLRVLDGRVTWITSRAALPLLESNPYIDTLAVIDDLAGVDLKTPFDLVINLEDEEAPAALAASVPKRELVGAYMAPRGVAYSESASEWFDMSLVSRFGRQRADQIKMANRRTYQEIVFSMFGLRFQGEEPVLNGGRAACRAGMVGIETRAGAVWPMKRWSRYEEFAALAAVDGFTPIVFQQRPSVLEYIDDISRCEFVVCGDTLAMHLALALGKQVVAIFTCTTPHEIFGYRRLSKVVSPLWQDYFYCRSAGSQPGDAIAAADVMNALSAARERLAAPLRSLQRDRAFTETGVWK